MIPIVSDVLRTPPQRIEKRTKETGNQTLILDHPDQSVVKIGKNIQNSPRDLKRLAVSVIPEKNYLLVLKPLKEYFDNNFIFRLRCLSIKQQIK